MQMQDLTGQQLGNYRLTKLLGKGGFATVYLGEHIFLGSQAKAAIKVLNETKLDEEERQRFLTEARTIRKLNHPRVVKVLDFGIEVSRIIDGSIPYLVMDLAPDGTLRNLHPRNTVVPTRQIIAYVDQVAEGLQFVHDQGFAHLDVKPENMLVMGINDIVLSDFGIAVTSYDSKNLMLTKDGVVQGTFAYIAPERFRGITRRASDQYALGIVVYEWLTGSLPFKGNAEQLIYEHLHTPPSHLYGVFPQISQEVDAIVMRALEKDPEQRYPSIIDFAQELHVALQAVAQPNVKMIYEPGPARQLEHNVGSVDSSKHDQWTDQQVDSEAITENVDLKGYKGERTQLVDPQVDSKPQIDLKEQLQPPVVADNLQPINSEPQIQKSDPSPVSPKQQQTGAGSQQGQQADINGSSRQQAEQRQRVYPDLQMWQQMMDYSSMRANRSNADVEPRPPETPQVNISTKGSTRRPFVQRLLKWFELDPDFARIPKNKMFRNTGIVLNVLSAILIGVLAQPPNGWLTLGGLLYSLVLFNLCISFVNMKLSMSAGLLVALYWGIVGLILCNGINLYGPYIPVVSPFLVTFLPPLLIAVFFVIASAFLHIRYVLNRLP